MLSKTPSMLIELIFSLISSVQKMTLDAVEAQILSLGQDGELGTLVSESDTQPWETKKKEITLTNKPFQIAIGSTGEPTIHPEFCEFLKTVYESGVVPNYTTNGITLALDSDLSEQLLDATRRYVGGVAVSFGNKSLRPYARRAIEKLIECGETKINIHHVISDMKSVDEFIQEWNAYGNLILYHVLLPLMPSGRSTTGVEEGVWEYLEEMIQKNHIENVAFGAHFTLPFLSNLVITTLFSIIVLYLMILQLLYNYVYFNLSSFHNNVYASGFPDSTASTD